MKLYKRINLIIVFILLAFTNIVHANDDIEELEEKKPFYSEYKESVNVNNGVKVTIVKSDKYGDFQDEYVSVDVNVENLNRYADLSFDIEALTGDDWTIKDSSKSGYLNSSDNKDYSFDYKYGHPKIPYTGKVEHIKLDRDIAFGDKFDRTTSSNAYERYYRDKSATESILNKAEDSKETNGNIFIYILAIVLIVIVLLFVVFKYVIRYIKSQDEFYSFFLIMTLSLAIALCSLFSSSKIYAYTQQSFLTDTEYSNTYTATVWSGGKDWTFRFKIKYKFIGNIPTYDKDQDSDGDGLTDNYEVYFMTDMYNADTDGDGISDYDEVYVINTNPLSIDTDNTGIKDGDRDYDRDGLTNIEEKNLNTFMDSIDTDSDNLTDYDEVKIYNTNPTLEDTDGDGLSDYEEVEVMKKLGLSDISTIDNNTRYNQELSSDNIDKNILIKNIIKVKVSGEVPGLIDNHIELKETNNEVLTHTKSVLGMPILVKNDYVDTDITIKFDCSNYKERIEGLTVATYDNGKIKIIESNINGNEVSANIKSGYVFVLDGIRYVDEIMTYKKDNYR